MIKKYYSLLASYELDGKKQFFETNLAPEFKTLVPHIAAIENSLKQQGVEKVEFAIKEFELKEIATRSIIDAECEEVSSEI